MRDNEERLRDAIESAETGVKTKVGKPRHDAPDVCNKCNLDHVGECF